MSLIPTDPSTWLDLAEHPFFRSKRFDPTWYDGDLHADLELLRATTEILAGGEEGAEAELVVLDDCTFFCRLGHGANTLCEVFPSRTVNNERCVFISFPLRPRLEIRAATPLEAKSILAAYRAGEDMTKFDSFE